MSIGFMYFLLPSILSLHLKSYCQTLQKFVILFHSKTSESSWHRNDQTPAKRSEICYACQCYQCTKSEDYQGPISTPDVISYMHETPSAMRKEFYLVKALSCEKQNIANSISIGAQSQGAILRISNIRFFLKQA